MRYVNVPAESAVCGQHADGHADQVDGPARVRRPSGAGAPRGPRARRSVRRPRLGAVREREDHAPVARFDAGGARSSRRNLESESSICAPRQVARQPTSPRSLGSGGDRRRRAPPRTGRRTRAHVRAERRRHSVRVEVADAAERRSDGAYDRVLVDPPCSGLGTLQSRPDLRWRASSESIMELASLQGRILAAGGDATAPGGSLVYSVCTISRRRASRSSGASSRSTPSSMPTICSASTPNGGTRSQRVTCSSCPTETAPTASSSRWLHRSGGSGSTPAASANLEVE